MTLLAVGCSGGGSSLTTATTTGHTITTEGQTTTTARSSPTTVGGTDDNAVYERVKNAVTAELTLYTDSVRFTDNMATLAGVDPDLKLGSGLSAPANPAIVNVAISVDAQWACLTGKSGSSDISVGG